MAEQVFIYDCTLRDGTQAENIALGVRDKLHIAEKLDSFGIHYIEGGWPGSNPKDAEFFTKAAKMIWKKREDCRLRQHQALEESCRKGSEYSGPA